MVALFGALKSRKPFKSVDFRGQMTGNDVFWSEIGLGFDNRSASHHLSVFCTQTIL